jgi:hypothetical protein
MADRQRGKLFTPVKEEPFVGYDEAACSQLVLVCKGRTEVPFGSGV